MIGQRRPKFGEIDQVSHCAVERMIGIYWVMINPTGPGHDITSSNSRYMSDMACGARRQYTHLQTRWNHRDP